MIAKNEDNVSIQDFTKLDVAIWTILEVSQNIKAKKPAYILKIDFGQNIGIKSTSAQITNYLIDELIGRQIVGICNLPSKNIAGFVSEVLVLGAVLGKEVHLLRTDNKLDNGLLIG